MRSKNTLWIALGSAFASALLTSWLAPKAIAWYFDPPVNIGINCRGAVEWSMAQLQKTQAAGFILGLGLGLLIAFRAKKRGENNSL